MKKSMILLGAFALLLAAPSFAQEKKRELSRTVKAEPMKEETVKLKKARSSNEELIAKPQAESKEVTEPKVVQKKARNIEPVKSEKLKKAEPIRKEESN
jgi:hypothetical protein